MPLIGSDVWLSFVDVGNPGNVTAFVWDNLIDDVIISSNVYTSNASLTYAPAGRNATITFLEFFFQPVTVTGPLAYERFNFSGTYLHGQGFVSENASIIFDASFLGFKFSQDQFSELGFPTWIDSMWQQGLIQHRLISFAYFTDSLFTTGGNVTIGAISESVSPEALTNYTVDINNGNWAFSLTDMQWDNLSLGFNGYLTIATINPLSVVPMPVFTTLVSLLGQPPLAYGELAGITYTIYNATQFPKLSVLPNITLYLHHQPLVIPPTRYMSCSVLSIGLCILTFGGASDVYPYKAAFTLGVLALNTTYSVFDSEQKTFGTAPIDVN